MADATQAMNVPTVTLNNGVTMPQIGLGVWQASEGDEATQAIATAFACGYRMIDTAKIYGNEQSVGEAVRTSGIAREDIFITTKLWNSDQGYDSALRAFDASLRRLGMEYIDLYLIHWPSPQLAKYVESWRALEQLYREQKVRAIGVSNFLPHHIEDLLRAPEAVAPAVNQVELHPHHQQAGLRDYCREHGIQVESYSPLKRGGDVLDEPLIRELASRYKRTPAQIVLRWHVQEGLVVIPKSVTPRRIEQNIHLFDFELNDDEMQQIRLLDKQERLLPHPDRADF